MKASELRKLLKNIPESTLSKYARDYAAYLSEAEQGRHRDYSEQDARVLQLVMEMKAEKVSHEDILGTLSSLEAGNWERLPELAEGARALVPTEANMVALYQERSAMQREIDILREMLTKATSDRDELLQRLHRAETLLELYQQGKLKPE